MNYELSLKLKKAGFPQNIKEDYYCEGCENCENGSIERYTKEVFDKLPKQVTDDFIKIPSLPELIDECGESFSILERRTTDLPEGLDFIFQAHGFKDSNKVEEGNYITKLGLTHKEAVANLWLELKKK